MFFKYKSSQNSIPEANIKAKTEWCDRSNLCFCDTFRTFISCSAIYFLEVVAHLSLKVATAGSFRCKKTSKMSIFEAINLSKNEVVRSIYVFRKILERLTLFNYIFSVSEYTRFIERSHQWVFGK